MPCVNVALLGSKTIGKDLGKKGTASDFTMYNLKQEAKAEEALTAAASEQPGSPEAMYYLGIIANSRGETDAASKWLRQAVAEGAGRPVAKRAAALLQELGLDGTAPAADGTATIAPGEG